MKNKTHLHPLLGGTKAVLHLLELSFQMLHPQTVTQTLPLSNLETRLRYLFLPANKPGQGEQIREGDNTYGSKNTGRYKKSLW